MRLTAACRPLESRRQRGFSLLEAVVAMVILASTGWAIMAWINANIASLRRIEEANIRSQATANALEYMQTVNPMLRPQGQLQLGGLNLSWTARAIAPPRDGSGYNSAFSLYRLGLYETTVRVQQGDEAGTAVEFRMKQVGYEQVRATLSSVMP